MRRSGYTITVMKKRRRRRVGRPRVITMKKLLGSGISRPYKDKNRLMLGSGKRTSKQRGGFFPIGPALAVAPAVIDLFNKIIK